MTRILPQLSEEDIKEFQALYAAELGIALSDAEAGQIAATVFGVVARLYGLD